MKHLLFIISLLISYNSFGKEIKVLEIDTGVSLTHIEIRNHVNMKYWESPQFFDGHGHGTHIAGLIIKDTCPEVELQSCSYFDLNNGNSNFDNSLNCFKSALKEHYDVINYSSSGPDKNKEEYKAIKQLSNQGTIIVVAAGNDHSNLINPDTNSYPAKYKIKNLVVVGNLNENGEIHKASNYGLLDMVWEMGTNIQSTFPGGRYGVMTGTSQATAIHTNKILKEMCNDRH